MAKKYRWCEAAGPVPYPDGSGRMLDNYEELVEGDDWEPLAALGFVEPVEGTAPKKKEASKAKPEPAPLPPSEKAAPEPVAAEKPEKPESSGDKKTVSEMVREAAAKSDEKPASVMDEAEKVMSKRKSKKKK